MKKKINKKKRTGLSGDFNSKDFSSDFAIGGQKPKVKCTKSNSSKVSKS